MTAPPLRTGKHRGDGERRSGGHGPAGLPVVSAGLSGRRQLGAAALLVAGLPALTAVLVAEREGLSYATPVLLVLTLIVAVALLGGLRVALPGAVLGGLVVSVSTGPGVTGRIFQSSSQRDDVWRG